MHKASYEEMSIVLKRLYWSQWSAYITMLDVGSYQENDGFGKTYRNLVPKSWKYVGIDVVAGPNVDVVMPEPYVFPLEDGEFGLAVSGQCLEHVENPFRLVREMARVCKQDGHVILVAPWMFSYHPYPIDCWRILPDGMRAVLEEAKLKVVMTYLKGRDCWGIGRKP